VKRYAAARLAVVLSAGILLAGCTAPASGAKSGTDATVPSPAVSAEDQALAPTVVSPGDLDGTDAAVVIGTSLVIAVPDGTESEWTGTTADLSIAEFSGGGPSEGAVFRPGFQPRTVGKTAATLTGPDGKTIDFTISVVAP